MLQTKRGNLLSRLPLQLTKTTLGILDTFSDLMVICHYSMGIIYRISFMEIVVRCCFAEWDSVVPLLFFANVERVDVYDNCM